VTLEANEIRQALLRQVITEVNAVNTTNQQYAAAKLFPPDINPQPLLYFGDPLTARFATFGANPAADELKWKRWPNAKMTVQELDARCVDYFKHPKTFPPNDWFDDYEKPPNTFGPAKALNHLAHSYRTDTVHLDFSPRATVTRRTMSNRSKLGKITKKEYDDLVEHYRRMEAADLPWFLRALTLGGNLKAAIMAGTVGKDPKRDYLDILLQNTLLQAHLPYSLKRRPVQLLEPEECPGRARASALYDLVGPELSIPVLFVSASPSGDQGVKVARVVQLNLNILKNAGFME
jgi:hypothetical protein